jgi:tetratricopeptide (TPR) repeat protein
MELRLLALCLAIALANLSVSAIVRAEAPEQTMQTLLAEAGTAQSKGDFAAAAHAYRKAAALEPDIPELWANLGLMDYESGNHPEAIRSFRQSIRLNPSLFVPQLFLGLEYLQSTKAQQALPHLETAVKLDPKDLRAIRTLGEAHATLGDIEKAIDLYWQAMRLNANDGSLWFDLGTSYLQQVENDARLMTSAYSDSAYVKLRSAEVLAAEGKLIDAERHYRAAVASIPPPPCAFAELGITLLRQQATSGAQQQFERELQSSPHCGLATLGLAVVDIVSGHQEAGLDKLAAMANSDPLFVRASLPLFRGSVTPAQVDALIAAAQSQARTSSLVDLADLIPSVLSPDDIVPAWHAAEESPTASVEAPLPSDARLLAYQGQYSRCDQALTRNPRSKNTGQLQLLAYCSFYAADFQTTTLAARELKKNTGTLTQGLYWESKADQNLALQALSRAGEIDSNSPRMHVLLGDVFRQEHHWDEAESEYRKAVVLDSKSHSARLGLAITLFTELKNDEALSLDESLLSENAADPEANLLAGEILVQRNQFRNAEPYLSKCSGLKTELLPRCHTLLGKVYAETERGPAAIAEFKLALSADSDGSIHYQLARLYQKSGNRAAAEAAFRESKRLVDKANNRERTALGQMGTDVSQQ